MSVPPCAESLKPVAYHFVEIVDACIGPNVTRCYRCPITTSTFAFMKALERCNFGGACWPGGCGVRGGDSWRASLRAHWSGGGGGGVHPLRTYAGCTFVSLLVWWSLRHVQVCLYLRSA